MAGPAPVGGAHQTAVQPFAQPNYQDFARANLGLHLSVINTMAATLIVLAVLVGVLLGSVAK
jgi:hypothetical protein